LIYITPRNIIVHGIIILIIILYIRSNYYIPLTSLICVLQHNYLLNQPLTPGRTQHHQNIFYKLTGYLSESLENVNSFIYEFNL